MKKTTRLQDFVLSSLGLSLSFSLAHSIYNILIFWICFLFLMINLACLPPPSPPASHVTYSVSVAWPGIEPGPLQWKHGVLSTRLPGTFLACLFLTLSITWNTLYSIFWLLFHSFTHVEFRKLSLQIWILILLLCDYGKFLSLAGLIALFLKWW